VFDINQFFRFWGRFSKQNPDTGQGIGVQKPVPLFSGLINVARNPVTNRHIASDSQRSSNGQQSMVQHRSQDRKKAANRRPF
jgi:hypothetical protein